MKIKVVGINARFTHSCLALFYLRSELERMLPEVEVEICQYTINDPYYLMLQNLLADRGEYLFFSALIWNSDLIEALVWDLLSVDAACRILIGGPQAEVIGDLFSAHCQVSVFKGAIEGAPPGFYDDLQSGNLQNCYEASFFKVKNREVGNPYRSEDFSGPLKNRSVYFESSRGCPFSCTYCLSSAENGLYHKKLDQVFGELDEILVHNPKSLRFVDRTFNDNPQRALAIWRYLVAKECSTLFHFEIAPYRFNEEMFKFLENVRPGRFQFEIGIQSTHRDTLKAIKRSIDPGRAGRLVNRLRLMENIHLHADLILGLPFDTPESFCQSVNDVFVMRPHYIQMGLLKLLPDTIIHARAERYGYLASSRPPYSVLASSWMDESALRTLFWMGECLERCYNNRYFVTLWNYLVSGGEDMAAFFLALTRRFHAQGYFEKATTQETLGRLLLEEMQGRDDFGLVKELISYDWLRCGHRFLPDYLSGPDGLNELRQSLYLQLPAEISGLYDSRSRSHFIKKTVFCQFSVQALNLTNNAVAVAAAVVSFLPEQDETVHRFNKTGIVEINN